MSKLLKNKIKKVSQIKHDLPATRDKDDLEATHILHSRIAILLLPDAHCWPYGHVDCTNASRSAFCVPTSFVNSSSQTTPGACSPGAGTSDTGVSP